MKIQWIWTLKHMELTLILWDSRKKGIGNEIYLHEMYDFFFIKNASVDKIAWCTISMIVKLVYLRIPWERAKIKPIKSEHI